jgi:hypothetical protein
LGKYQGDEAFSEDQAFLVNTTDSFALPLQPLLFWSNCDRHPDSEVGHCYVFDTKTKEGASFKAAGHSCVLEIARSDRKFTGLNEYLTGFESADRPIDLVTIGTIEPWRSN